MGTMTGTQTPITSRAGAEETYHDVVRLIHSRIRPHIKRGADEETLLSYAHEGFVHAYQTYNPNKGAFSTHLTWRLRAAVSRYWKDHKSHSRVQCFVDQSIMPEQIHKQERRDWEKTQQDLPEDAKVLVGMALNPPIPVIMRCVELAVDKEQSTTATLGIAVREALRDSGWSKHRITRALSDLFAAMS